MICLVQWAQLKESIPTMWKTPISNFIDIGEKTLYQNHCFIKGARNLSADKLSSEKQHSILISNIVNKNTPNI